MSPITYSGASCSSASISVSGVAVVSRPATVSTISECWATE
ncbi:hypothetical protein [Hoeflea olei]|nr:hypothetical protein [Hoeflea olei]